MMPSRGRSATTIDTLTCCWRQLNLAAWIMLQKTVWRCSADSWERHTEVKTLIRHIMKNRIIQMVNWTLFLIVKYLLSISSVMSLYIQSRFHSKENLDGRNQNKRKMFNFIIIMAHLKMTHFHKTKIWKLKQKPVRIRYRFEWFW